MLVRRSVLAMLALMMGLGAACGSTAYGGTAWAAEKGTENRPENRKDPTHASGLPIPRFVTVRVGEVNLRSGPNGSYPIEWVFRRKDMPVEIIQEFDTWRRIRDWEGAEGWVHQSALSGRRGVLIVGQTRTVHEAPRGDSAVVARAEPGVIGSLKKCRDDWCEVELKGYRGWMKRADFWGTYAGEKIE